MDGFSGAEGAGSSAFTSGAEMIFGIGMDGAMFAEVADSVATSGLPELLSATGAFFTAGESVFGNVRFRS